MICLFSLIILIMSPACLQSIGLPLACPSEFCWTSVGYVHWNSISASPSEVHQKSLLDFVVQPKMPRQAPENPWKNTEVKKQKKISILLTLSLCKDLIIIILITQWHIISPKNTESYHQAAQNLWKPCTTWQSNLDFCSSSSSASVLLSWLS